MGVFDYSTTPASNNAAPPNGWPEGMLRSAVNDVGRQHYADIADMLRTFPWLNLAKANTLVRNSNTQFQFNSVDLTSRYSPGRRVRETGATTVYGRITSSVFSSGNTVVDVVNDSSANVPTSLTSVDVCILTPESGFSPSYFSKTSDQSVTSGLTDITSLTGLLLPNLSSVNTRMFEVKFNISVQDTSGAVNAVAMRIYNGTNGDKNDTFVYQAGGVSLAANASGIIPGLIRFTPGASDRTKFGVVSNSVGSFTAFGASGIVSNLTIEEVF